MTTIVPDDLIEEILLRLPVKHLVQLKCVCRHWYALIGDSAFHKKHYHFQHALHVAEHNDVPLFIDDTPSDPLLPTKINLLSKLQGADVVLNVTPDFERDVSAAFANDLILSNLRLYCNGIVNGVVCLEWDPTDLTQDCERLALLNPPSPVTFFVHVHRLALWNPATREFKSILRWPIVPDHEAARVIREKIIGFGFDLRSNDFKMLGLVHFDGFEDEPTFYECHLYSLNANSWRRIEDAPFSLLHTYHSLTDAYLNNGVYYWLADENGRYTRRVIISFNFSTEISKEFEPPEDAFSHHYYGFILGKYNEGLALVVWCSPPQEDVKINIWAVTEFRDDDHGVPSSWQLVLTVGAIPPFNGLWVISVRVCGDLLIVIQRGSSEEEEVGCLFDPSTNTFKFLEVLFGSSFSYVESLFSLSGPH